MTINSPAMRKRNLLALWLLVLAAACATPPPPPPPAPPPPPPPPPPVAEAIPYRPLPPPQASYQMPIPRRDESGLRRTLNSDLDHAETIWHFRSGWNVAALNCTGAQYEPITEGYRLLLTRYAGPLAAANEALEQRYRAEESARLRANGQSGRAADVNRAALLTREAKSTVVYNYFTSPPVRADFCRTALGVANEMIETPPDDLFSFASNSLRLFENTFERFFSTYEAYEAAAYEWDVKYGAAYGPSQPGWVAVYGDMNGFAAAGFAVADPVETAITYAAGQAAGDPVPVTPVD